MSGDGYMEAIKENQVAEGESRAVEIGNMPILIHRHQGKFYATGAFCPHQEVRLDPANRFEDKIVCKSHGYRMSVVTGECWTDPELPYPSYPVKVEGGQVWVKLL